MRRVVSLYLPTWPTDRIRRNAGVASPWDKPLVTAMREGSRRVIAAADAKAQALGLWPGQTIAHAQAFVPDLQVVEAAPGTDGKGLARLAAWCMRYSPLVALDPPNGIWIEVAGSARLFGGEAELITDLGKRLCKAGIMSRAAIVDTPGAAWAVARYGSEPIVAPGCIADAIADLPVAALRLAPETVAALCRLGIERIGQVSAMPSAPLMRRFGAEVRRRLDQALGHAGEPFHTLIPPETIHRRMAFAEPVGSPSELARVTARLCVGLCRDLAQAGMGARRLDLVCSRVDKAAQAVRIGTARPTRDLAHLARLLTDRVDRIDPGFGIEEAMLIATRVEPLAEEQTSARGLYWDDPDVDLGSLVDRLSLQLGEGCLYRHALVESDIPERSVEKLHPLAPPTAVTWPASVARPLRLLDPPEPIFALARMPDYPPPWFEWRHVRRRVVRADGPERIVPEWWRAEDETASTRDYFRIEDEKGGRYWLFRLDDGRWFIHGLFA